MMGGSNATEGAALKPVGPAWRVGNDVHAVQNPECLPRLSTRQEKRGSWRSLLPRKLPRTAEVHARKLILHPNKLQRGDSGKFLMQILVHIRWASSKTKTRTVTKSFKKT